MPGWLSDIFRSFFFFIDEIIYKFIDTVYGLFLEIANTSIFTEEMINAFAGKVYALVGIFMLFKVSFSLLTYIINPDEFADKNKGMGKLIKNIVTSLALFILVPMIFSEAMDIQKIILKDDIIPRIFSTTEEENVPGISVSSMDSSMGNQLASVTFRTFYETEVDYELKDIFNTDVNQRDSNNNYIVKYTYLISSAVGVVLALILISFCFDVAVRSVKLGFLRLIAPVPIMTRIDPKKGEELFNKWVKNCISTYLDLFMRLAAIFFAIYVIKAVTTESGFVDAVTGDKIEVGKMTVVFIILGALMFAKQLPKLIEDLFGIKLSGTFSLNPAKKLAEVPLAGNLAARTLGAAGSLMAHEGFSKGWKAGGKAVPLGGTDKGNVFGGMSRFTEEGRKKIAERKDKLAEHKLGEKLYDKAMEKGEGSIYEGKNAAEYAKSVEEVNKAKDRKNSFQSEYEKAKMAFEAEKDTLQGEELDAAIKRVDDARVAAVKAESDYDKVKKAHEFMRSQDSRNAKIEDAFNKAKDSHEASSKVRSWTPPDSSSGSRRTSTGPGSYTPNPDVHPDDSGGD